MQIVFQLGVHCTDDGRLVRSLLRSRGPLIHHGVTVPPPRRYRSMLRETLNILAGAPATSEAQELLIDTLTDEDGIRRIVLFHESLICIPQRAISDEGLYPMAPRRIAAFRNLFPDHEVEFHLALCNPAILVPTLALRAGPDGYEAVTDGARVQRLSWFATISRILEANPEARLTLWCNEDTPLIWPEVLRTLAGVGSDVALEGDFDLLAALLTDEGLAALQAEVQELAPDDAGARRAAITRALEAHGRSEEIEIPIALPGWTEALIAEITERYEQDCEAAAGLPGVRFLQP
jgi:hypothetical protein